MSSAIWRNVRGLGWVVLWVGILGGCAASGSRKPGADGGTNAVDVIRPMDGSVGRIVRVQAPLKFVVVDYRLNQPPAPEQRLVVLRDGERVAELKAGYIRRETTVSADILSGEPRDGDEVRIDEGAAPVAR